jgi:hypothetical protein
MQKAGKESVWEEEARSVGGFEQKAAERSGTIVAGWGRKVAVVA